MLLYNFTFLKNITIPNGPTGTPFSVPDQLVVKPVTPATPTETSTAYLHLSDFTNAQVAQLTKGTMDIGYFTGLTDPALVNAEYYERGVALSRYVNQTESLSITLDTAGLNLLSLH